MWSRRWVVKIRGVSWGKVPRHLIDGWRYTWTNLQSAKGQSLVVDCCLLTSLSLTATRWTDVEIVTVTAFKNHFLYAQCSKFSRSGLKQHFIVSVNYLCNIVSLLMFGLFAAWLKTWTLSKRDIINWTAVFCKWRKLDFARDLLMLCLLICKCLIDVCALMFLSGVLKLCKITCLFNRGFDCVCECHVL